MVDLLVYEAAFARLESRLGAVRALVMDDAGAVRRGGKVLKPAEVAPQIAWANRDLYTRGPVRDFMVACLKAPGLRWLQSSAAGFEHPVFAKLIGNGVRLSNANASAVSIAEFVLAEVLAAFHPGEARRRAQAERRWEALEFRDVAGTTWMVFGLGSIGAEIARRARAFDARVIGCRRTARGDEPVDEMISPARLLERLPEADVVVLASALNDSTRGIVDRRFLAAMRDAALLVNVGRGALVDEAALRAGLDRGRPSLAILDVFEAEPLPPNNPLWVHPRVRVTAHCAGASEGTSRRGDEIFLDNLRRYLAGEPLANEVREP